MILCHSVIVRSTEAIHIIRQRRVGLIILMLRFIVLRLLIIIVVVVLVPKHMSPLMC